MRITKTMKKENVLIFSQILSRNSLRILKCMEISLENLYEDIEGLKRKQRVYEQATVINKKENIVRKLVAPTHQFPNQ